MKKEYEEYVIEARGIDVDFQRALYTKCSFIKEFDSLYGNKMIIDEDDIFGNSLTNLYDYYEALEEAYTSYNCLLERFSSEQSINYEEAHKFILKHLKSSYPDVKINY